MRIYSASACCHKMRSPTSTTNHTSTVYVSLIGVHVINRVAVIAIEPNYLGGCLSLSWCSGPTNKQNPTGRLGAARTCSFWHNAAYACRCFLADRVFHTRVHVRARAAADHSERRKSGRHSVLLLRLYPHGPRQRRALRPKWGRTRRCPSTACARCISGRRGSRRRRADLRSDSSCSCSSGCPLALADIACSCRRCYTFRRLRHQTALGIVQVADIDLSAAQDRRPVTQSCAVPRFTTCSVDNILPHMITQSRTWTPTGTSQNRISGCKASSFDT